jgi:hypothetical protein
MARFPINRADRDAVSNCLAVLAFSHSMNLRERRLGIIFNIIYIMRNTAVRKRGQNNERMEIGPTLFRVPAENALRDRRC